MTLQSSQEKFTFVMGQIKVGIGALRRSGVIKSLITGKPVDQKGNPIPWLTYSAIYEIEKRLHLEDRVLEFGSGHSSMWFAKRVKSVDAVESNEEWSRYVQMEALNKGISNLNIKYMPIYDPKIIVSMIEKSSVILIDGSWRHQVAALVAEDCASKLIIIDNTDAGGPYSGLPDLFNANGEGRQVVRLNGLGPCLLHTWETTLILPSKN